MENRRFNWAVFEQECRREIEHLDAMVERIQGIIDNLDRYLQTLKEVNEFAKKVRELPHEVTIFVDMERVGTSGFIHIA